MSQNEQPRITQSNPGEIANFETLTTEGLKAVRLHMQAEPLGRTVLRFTSPSIWKAVPVVRQIVIATRLLSQQELQPRTVQPYFMLVDPNDRHEPIVAFEDQGEIKMTQPEAVIALIALNGFASQALHQENLPHAIMPGINFADERDYLTAMTSMRTLPLPIV